MAALLPPGEIQFCDTNGAPYAGGTVTYYVPGTTTLKNTWSESTGTVLNTNPVVLDSAGRAIVYGSGAYRMVLTDALGNLIYDQLTSSLVSNAMAPVLLAADLPTALAAMGVTAAITAEANMRYLGDAAIVALVPGFATVAGLATEVLRAETAEAALTAALAAETARAVAAETALGIARKVQSGSASTDASGHARVTFSPAFTSCTAVTAQIGGSGVNSVSSSVSFNNSYFDVWMGFGVPVAPALVGF
jgi:hypothetical protein